MGDKRALLLCLLPLVACGEAGPDEGRAFIQGVVRNVETGTPLAEVAVRSAPATESVFTDSDGRFVLRDGVRFNQIYRVFAERNGFASDFADFTPRATEPERSVVLELQQLRVCSPGSTRCADGSEDQAVQRCTPDGTGFETVACAPDEVCSVDTCVASGALRVESNGGLVTSRPAGISCRPNCEARFPAGTEVELVAQAFAGGDFRGWSSPCPEPMSPRCLLTLVGGATVAVTASFDQSAFPLSVDFVGDGEGRVVSEPAGLDCTADCTTTFERDSQVRLLATAEPGTVFEGWGGACSGMNCVLTMDEAQTVRARFEVPRARLTVNRSGAGSVRSTPAGIDCGSDCSFDFSLGTTVELTAQPAPENEFVSWSGDCGGSGDCSVTMDGDRTVAAEFEGQSFDLTVSLSGPGVGSVSSDPAGIDCGADCDETFGIGAMVSLTATAAAGNRFAGWSGDCVGMADCTVLMDQ
ncbi:MAG: hypothetical protein AAF627_13610, partial [Myxococcota bacterium]